MFKLLEASFELLVPLVVKRIIDVGIAGGDRIYIRNMVFLMIALGVIGLVCSLTAQFFSAKAAVGFATRVKKVLFSHIQTLSYTELDTIGTSAMITRMTSDINQLQNGVNMSLRLFLRSPFVVFGAMIMAFTIDTRGAFTFVWTIAALSVVVYGIMLITIPMYKVVQKHLDKVLKITRSGLGGVRVIRAFGMEEEELKEFSSANNEHIHEQLKVGRISALLNPVTFVLINAGTIYLIYEGALAVDSGRLTQGAVVALVNYMSQILVELIKLANMILLLMKAIACGNRIGDVLKTESSMKEGSNEVERREGPGEVVFEKVSMSYAGSTETAVEDISFSVRPGETLGIIGGTGSGKTSVVSLIPRFYDVKDGRVFVDGVDVRDYTYESLRGRIAIVPQRSVLFRGSIRKNMQWGRKDATDEEIRDALKTAQALDFVEEKGEGLEYCVAAGGKNFSGGQRQRLAIARALVRKPEILILDDSASALDYATDAALRKAIREMNPSPTVLIVSQRSASIMYADQILVLDDGRVAGLGKHEDLLENCAVYREIYESQFCTAEGRAEA